VLDGVLDQRLHHQGRDLRPSQLARHVDAHAQALFETLALDVQVVLHELQLSAERRELALGTQHAAKQRCQSQQRAQGPGRRGLDQVSDRRQRVEEEVRLQLRPQALQSRLDEAALQRDLAPYLVTLPATPRFDEFVASIARDPRPTAQFLVDLNLVVFVTLYWISSSL